jgi:hypothetical protein
MHISRDTGARKHRQAASVIVSTGLLSLCMRSRWRLLLIEIDGPLRGRLSSAGFLAEAPGFSARHRARIAAWALAEKCPCPGPSGHKGSMPLSMASALSAVREGRGGTRSSSPTVMSNCWS